MNSTSTTYREFADRVRAAADIVEVVQQYVELKRAGANFKGLCPFHQEKTPSFHVHPGKQIFKCFGCGKSGDVVAFVREIERADFRQALTVLAEKYGIEIPRFKAKGPEEEQTNWRQTLSAALEASTQYYQKRLAHPTHGERARQYLKERGGQRRDGREVPVGSGRGGLDGAFGSFAGKGVFGTLFARIRGIAGSGRTAKATTITCGAA